MTFEQFAAVVRDWAGAMTPAQVRLATEGILVIVDDPPPGISTSHALVLAAEGEPVAGAALLLATKSEPASMLTGEPRKQAAPVGERERNGSAPGAATSAAPQLVGERARALVREQLRHGPKPGAQIEAAAQAAAIPKSSLIAAASVLGVRTQRGQWWIPGR
jgi:hypothetical protein